MLGPHCRTGVAHILGNRGPSSKVVGRRFVIYANQGRRAAALRRVALIGSVVKTLEIMRPLGLIVRQAFRPPIDLSQYRTIARR